MKSQTLALSLFVAFCSSGFLAEETKGIVRLVVQKSGGIAAIQQTYEVAADGKYKVSDLKGSSKGELTGDELKAFVAAVNAVNWAEIPPKQLAKTGTDQFLYTVAIITDNKFYSRTFHENAHPDNEPLKTFLAALAKVK